MNKGTEVSAHSRILRSHSIAAGIIIVTVWMHLSAQEAAGQTNMKDRYVTLAVENQRSASIARPAMTHQTVVVWEDYRNGYSQIYAQLLDSANGIAQWFPIDGVPVSSNTSHEQRHPRAVYDTLGGVIVTWEDYRNDASWPFDPVSGVSEIYANRLLLTTGEQDPNWNGSVKVGGSTGYRAERPRIVGAGDGAFITWTDYRNAGGTPTTNIDVFVKHITSYDGQAISGTLWSQNGTNASGPNNTNRRRPEIILDSVRDVSNGRRQAFIVYEDDRDTVSQIFAQAYGWNGSVLLSDHAVAPPTCLRRTGQINPRVVPVSPVDSSTGHRGAVIVWQDGRDSNSNGWDVWSQAFDLDQLASMWPLTGPPFYGAVVCDYTEDQENPALDAWERYAAVAWEDARDAAGTGMNIYGNRLQVFGTGCGTVITTSGMPICTVQENQFDPVVEIRPHTSRATICWVDPREYTVNDTDIYLQQINIGDWTELWDSDGIAVTKSVEDQIEPDLGCDVVTFTDRRRVSIANDTQEDENIYAEKIGYECDEPTNMHWKDVLAQWTPGVQARNQRMAVDDSGNTYIVWHESRILPTYAINAPGIYIQKLDPRGVPRWTNDGILLSDTTLESGLPDVCPNEDGGAIATWQEVDNGAYRVVMAGITVDGMINWTTYPPVTNEGKTPRIVENDQGGAWVAYEDVGNTIFVYEVGVDGQPLLSGPDYRYPDVDADQLIDPRISKDRLGGCYVVGRRENNGWRVHPFRITVNGSRCENPDNVFYPDPTLTEFGGFDLATDVLVSPISNVYDGLLACSNGTNILVYKLLFPSATPDHNQIDGGAITLAAAGNTRNCYPSIDYDSTLSPTAWWLPDPIGGGAIVAYDHAEYYPMTQLWRHGVETNRVYFLYDQNYPTSLYYDTWWNSSFMLPFGRQLAFGAFQPTYPDICRVHRRAQAYGSSSHEPTIPGIVAWQDDSYSNCNDLGIITAAIDYNESLIACFMWPTEGVVSPNPGDQCVPLVQRSGCDQVSMCWLDTRAGDTLVAFTELSSLNGTMVLSRRSQPREDAPSNTFRLDQNYPNPIVSGQGATIQYTLGNDGYALLRVVDMLGREVCVLANGYASAGEHFASIQPGLLAPGEYICSLRYDGGIVSRTMIVVR